MKSEDESSSSEEGGTPPNQLIHKKKSSSRQRATRKSVKEPIHAAMDNLSPNKKVVVEEHKSREASHLEIIEEDVDEELKDDYSSDSCIDFQSMYSISKDYTPTFDQTDRLTCIERTFLAKGAKNSI